MSEVMTVFQHPVVQGAIGGLIVAARVDYAAFAAWQSFGDAAGYNWWLASWRWFQGALIGALAALGFSAV